MPASSLRSFGRLSAAEGAVPVLVAAAVAGAAGYLIGIVVPAAVAPASYAAFSLVWSAQFLTVSALSGVQQEVGRASAPLQSAGPGGGGVDGVRQVLSFARRLAVVVALVAAMTAALLVWRGVLPGSAILPLTLGAAAFAVVAVLTGLLYGLGRTGVVALVVCCEWVLRCVLVVLALAASSDLAPLLWAIALPTLLAPVMLVGVLRSALSGGVGVDVPVRQLARNVLLAVVSCIASGMLISGFPIVMAGLTDSASDPRLPGINLAITLIRSPIVVGVVALQAFLVVRFRDAAEHGEALMWRFQAGLVALTIVATGAAAVLGPPALGVFGADYRLSGWFIAGLVFASGLLGSLCVVAALALARSLHGAYLVGWLSAAGTAVLALILPIGGLEARVIAALVAAPVLGLAVQIVAIRRAG